MTKDFTAKCKVYFKSYPNAHLNKMTNIQPRQPNWQTNTHYHEYFNNGQRCQARKSTKNLLQTWATFQTIEILIEFNFDEPRQKELSDW